jgi:hypothetical protein
LVLDIFSLAVIGIIIALVIWLVVLLGPMPGNIAKKRGHPQADAINVLGWIGIITLGLAWPFALVWAYYRSGDQQTQTLSDQVVSLQAQIKGLESQGDDA